MRISVTKSPHSEDGDFPWVYDYTGFLMWYDEVFQEGYKKDTKDVPVNEAIADLEGMGYEIDVDERACPSCGSESYEYYIDSDQVECDYPFWVCNECPHNTAR